MPPQESNKRKADVALEEEATKRSKPEGTEGSNGSAAAAKRKGIVDLSVLEKAKKALQMQKELKEKLERLKQAGTKATSLAAGAPLPTSATAQATRFPPPLVLDELGREARPAEASHRAPSDAAATGQAEAIASARPALPVSKEFDRHDASHFDPALGTRGLRRLQRRARPALNFLEQGALQKRAEAERLKAEFGDDAAAALAERRRREEAEARAAAAGGDANLVPLGTRVPAVATVPAKEPAEPPVPNVEWWDARILANKTSYETLEIRPDRITHLIEHPVLLEPPAEAPPPPPQPLRLTKGELKKLRTQRRLAREQEKQELVRQGLLEPPKPKVKISNLMRVLGAEATADPTAIEAEVRRQMAERVAAHEDRNLARMLTPSERREKKLRKLLGRPVNAENGDDGPVETQVAVYKVGNLSTPQIKFKVEINARENHLTGIAVAVPEKFAVVVVEGGAKPQRRYERLMLQRIKWELLGEGNDDDMHDGDGQDGLGGVENYCHLVWTGVVKESTFRGRFKIQQCASEAMARQLLEEQGMAHYWDLAAAFSTD